jgi:hypothetical protein
MSEKNTYLEFKAPCCYSVRTCNVTADYVISLKTARILRRIDAVRCYRGHEVIYKFYPAPDVALINHYVSNRSVHYITIRWKPENVSTEEVLEKARRALGLTEEIDVRVE